MLQGPQENVAGQMLFMHLRRDCTMGQVQLLLPGTGVLSAAALLPLQSSRDDLILTPRLL